jgi:hypothetical protein
MLILLELCASLVEIRALRTKGKLAMFYFVSTPIPQAEMTGSKHIVVVTPGKFRISGRIR